jgi:hypothetical protein
MPVPCNAGMSCWHRNVSPLSLAMHDHTFCLIVRKKTYTGSERAEDRVQGAEDRSLPSRIWVQ